MAVGDVDNAARMALVDRDGDFIDALNPLPTTGGGGGGAVTVADGADVAQGTTTDAPVDAAEGATARTSISLLKGIKNYLRSLSANIVAGIAGVGPAGKTLADVVSALSSVAVTGTFYPATQPVSMPSVANCTAIVPTASNKTVSSAGTAEALAASSTPALMLYVRAKEDNTGNVYVGDSNVDKDSSQQIILSAGQDVSISAPPGYRLDVAQFYIDVDTNDEGVDFLYVA